MRGTLILGPIACVGAFNQPQIAEGEPLACLLNAGAWAFILLFVANRIWATLFIGDSKSTWLQTDGNYSVCRNPLYLGSFCFALALAFLLKSATFAVGIVVLSVVYANFAVRAEEHNLGLWFSEDFSNYCRRTPRFWPRWSSLSSPVHLRVNMEHPRQECLRLGRAALIPIFSEAVVKCRGGTSWPQWFQMA